MTEKYVWLITGAGHGMGVDIARAALAAGNAVVATGRNSDAWFMSLKRRAEKQVPLKQKSGEGRRQWPT